MAVRLQKASVLLEHSSTSFIQQCCSIGKPASVTTPPISLHGRPAILRVRGRGQISSEPTTAKRSSISGVRRGSKYIINPSRYPPHLLQARPSCDPPLTRNMQELSQLPEEKSYFVPDMRVPPLLSCVSLPRERATHLDLPLSLPPLSLLPHNQMLLPAAGVPMLDIICAFSSSSSLLSSQPDPPPRDDDRPTPSQMAFVLLKLREEIPAFFDGHHSVDLYAPDMMFENSLGHKSWTVQGSTAYSALLTCWRVGVKTCFTQTHLDLLKISKDVEAGKVEARWRARGRPRAPWKTRERIIVEAFSTFHVRGDGNIAIHKVDKVMPGGKEPNRVMSWLARVGVALIPSPPQPSIGVTRTSHDIIPNNA